MRADLLADPKFNRAAVGILGTGAGAPPHAHVDDCAHARHVRRVRESLLLKRPASLSNVAD